MYLKGLTCQTCHGSVAQVAQSIANGREPWLQEPSCGAVTCHGSNYAEQPGKLFRQSRGHGSLFCSACHGSPHAIYSTREANDNLQNIMLQGFKGTLRTCSVCHGYTPTSPGPHGLLPSAIETISGTRPPVTELLDNFPNPFSTTTTIPFRLHTTAKVDLSIYETGGRKVMTLIHDHMNPGEYRVELPGSNLPDGLYYYGLVTGNDKQFKKLIVVR
jgi:hypothetical protein